MDKEIIKDFGEWNLPTSWDDLSLKQYQNIEKIYTDDKNVDIRSIIEALGEHSKDEVGQLPIEFADKLLEQLTWLFETPKFNEPTNKVEVDGVIYKANVQNKLKVGEYVAVDTVIKSDPNNYAAIMAILCRKEGELYDSKFENEILEERIKMWENVSVMKVVPVVNFFLQCWLISEIPTQLSIQMEEELNLIAKSIENSDKIGVFKRRSMTSQIKKLRKLLKSIKNT